MGYLITAVNHNHLTELILLPEDDRASVLKETKPVVPRLFYMLTTSNRSVSNTSSSAPPRIFKMCSLAVILNCDLTQLGKLNLYSYTVTYLLQLNR